MASATRSGGTKRLPRAVREQQMLDAALEVFSRNGFHETSMDAIAAEAQISKPMLYLYYGSKDELFTACINRESQRFLEAIAPVGDPNLSPREQVQAGLAALLNFVDNNRRSWQVLYRETTAQQAFASQVASSRERVVELTANLLRASSKRADADFYVLAVAIIGAGEAIANHMADGQITAEAAAPVLEELAWRGLAGRRTEE